MKNKMKNQYLNIHLEGMDDNGEKLRRIHDENIPCAISIAPETLREKGIYSKQYPYLPAFVDFIRKIVNKPGNILGQQGNMHKCKHRHRITDSWHENSCPYHKSLSVEEQRKIMRDGNETLFRLLGKRAEMYVPPNHLFNQNTLDAACEEKYPFLIMRGLTIIDPLLYQRTIYDDNDILVVPETKFRNLGSFKYVHYDGIKNNELEFEEAVGNAGSFKDIRKNFDIQKHYIDTKFGPKPDPITLEKHFLIIEHNRKATNKRKILRDIKNLPRRILKI